MNMYAYACCGNATAGATPFRCIFVECDLCIKRDFDLEHVAEVVLVMKREQFLATHQQLPFGGAVNRGRLVHLTHWDLAARLLTHCDAFGSTVEIALLAHRELHGDKFIIDGEDGRLAKLVIAVDTLGAREGGARSHGCDEVDWDHVTPPRSSAASVRENDGMEGEGDAYAQLAEVLGECAEVASEVSGDGISDVDDSSSSEDDTTNQAPASSSGPPLRFTRFMTIGDLFNANSEFCLDVNWKVRKLNSGSPPLGKITPVGGHSLRAECACHRMKGQQCKLFLEIKGRFEEVQCVLAAWVLEGRDKTADEHKDMGRLAIQEWANYVAVHGDEAQ